jgi:hypothetical protein
MLMLGIEVPEIGGGYIDKLKIAAVLQVTD